MVSPIFGLWILVGCGILPKMVLIPFHVFLMLPRLFLKNESSYSTLAFFIAMLTLLLKALKCIQVSLDPALDATFFALSLSNINFLRSGVSQGEFEFRTFFRRKGACKSHMFKNIFLQAFQATLGSVIFSTDCHGARAKVS